MNMKRKLACAAALLLLVMLGAWLWLLYRDGGVTHRELSQKIETESMAVQSKVDARYDALEKKLDRIESKLDSVESKLDRLIQLATPRLPDGMKTAE